MTDAVIAKLDGARTALREAKTIQETKRIHDVAIAAEVYARRQELGEEAIGYAHAIKIEALSQLGKLLEDMPKNTGAKGIGTSAVPVGNHTPARLSDLGISKKTSMVAQQLAALPEETRAEIAERETTLKDALRAQKRQPISEPLPPSPNCRTTSDLQELINEGELFSTIYADPPWRYGNQATRASTDNHYGTMTVNEICDLPIARLVDKNAHLHLWTTNAFLEDAFKVLRAWGFEYKSVFVWCKPQMGIGNYWRVSHEFLLFGLRGSLPFRDRGMMSWAAIDRGEHSEKPIEVLDRVERVSPAPYLELFGRIMRPGWTIFGNQISNPAEPRMRPVEGPLFVGAL